MARLPRALLSLAVIATSGAVILWWATGRHAITKYRVIERVRLQVDPDDPFAATGFYDGEGRVGFVGKDEFHLGIFPEPAGLLDKHVVSVMTIAMPPWAAFGISAWLARRSRRSRRRGGGRGSMGGGSVTPSKGESRCGSRCSDS